MSNSSGFIYGNFRPYVDKQIKTRQNILSAENRDNNNLLYISGKTAWIKMTSSVNITDESYLGKQYPNLLGDGLAKAYTLFGGVLYNQNNKDTLRDSFGLSSNPNSPINYGLGGSQEAGFRPMPGIIKADIKSRNQFGSLKEATINFKCWNLKQLEILEALYLRVGYQVLLEWGSTIYYTGGNNGENPVFKGGKNISYVNFFEKGTTQQKILQDIDFLRLNSQGNYDGILGVVKNFNFVASPDGGYDCTVYLITWGEIVESLKINYISNDIISPSTPSVDSLLLEENLKSDFNLVLNYLKLKETKSKSEAISLSHNIPKILSLLSTENYSYLSINSDDDIVSLKKLSAQEKDIIDQVYSVDFTINSGTAVPYKYIPLASLLNILRNLCLLRDQNNNSILNINISPENNYSLSNPFQISIDPRICLLPSVEYADNTNSYSKEQLYGKYGNYPYSPRISENSNLINFLKIAINIDFIKSCLETSINVKTGNIYLYDFMNKILEGINKATGMINKYDIIIDNNNVLSIVDAQLLPVYLKPPSTINVSQDNLKKKSFVKSYSFSSRITKDLINTIAISAQANSQTINTSNVLFSRLNKGLIDRITSEKTVFSSTQNDEVTKQKNTLNKIYNIADFVSQNLIPKAINTSQIDIATNILKEILNLIIVVKGEAYTFIPIDINLVLDGISGIRIGECFTIEENKIPNSYKNIDGNSKIKFLVREISQTIESNSWSTSITGISVAYTNPK